MGFLTAPFRGLLWIFEEVADRADRMLYGEEELRTDLGELHADWEAGRVGDEEFERREAELIHRLAEAERRNRSRQR